MSGKRGHLGGMKGLEESPKREASGNNEQMGSLTAQGTKEREKTALPVARRTAGVRPGLRWIPPAAAEAVVSLRKIRSFQPS